MNSGVYKITCTINGNYYYGSSVNLKSRFINHINKLRSQLRINLILFVRQIMDSYIYSLAND